MFSPFNPNQKFTFCGISVECESTHEVNALAQLTPKGITARRRTVHDNTQFLPTAYTRKEVNPEKAESEHSELRMGTVVLLTSDDEDKRDFYCGASLRGDSTAICMTQTGPAVTRGRRATASPHL